MTGVTLGSALISSTMVLMRWPMSGSVRRAFAGGPEDDLLGVARMGRRHRLQQVDGVEGLGVREAGSCSSSSVPTDDTMAMELDENGQPQQDDDTAMTDTPPGQGAH